MKDRNPTLRPLSAVLSIFHLYYHISGIRNPFFSRNSGSLLTTSRYGSTYGAYPLERWIPSYAYPRPLVARGKLLWPSSHRDRRRQCWLGEKNVPSWEEEDTRIESIVTTCNVLIPFLTGIWKLMERTDELLDFRAPFQQYGWEKMEDNEKTLKMGIY